MTGRENPATVRKTADGDTGRRSGHRASDQVFNASSPCQESWEACSCVCSLEEDRIWFRAPATVVTSVSYAVSYGDGSRRESAGWGGTIRDQISAPAQGKWLPAWDIVPPGHLLAKEMVMQSAQAPCGGEM
jgi:hypothetical protein